MPVPLLDLHRQYDTIKADMDRAVLDVLEHGKFILGPEVKRLEQEIAALCGVKHAIGTASGTDALLIALRAVGVKPGDEVITSNFSFFASAGVIARLGARPVFVDIEPDTYNIDPKLVEAALTPRTKAIVPVHLFGQLADMDPIMEIARRRGIKVIEDAAQAIGAEYKGRRAGSIGDLGCFSFYPSKNLGGGGDGGMIVTNEDQTERSCRSLRVHGENPKYFHHTIGYNSRLDTLQAAMLLVKLPHLRAWSEKRIEHARIYGSAFAGVPNLRVPVVKDYSTFHIFNQYTVASPRRDRILEGLNRAGIGNCIYYPMPFHQQKCFAYLDYALGDFPVSNRSAAEVFSIPIYPEMTPSEQQEVIDTVRRLAVEP
ncbi:MAG: DegT/DnrJ/EryC1/StrS family aminotransferase [candidate division Zixibacteria bacterium]|nr:DegT/DnrJ/EryC1/StrS family aminotransferase [candidate division Zixibacteria bacterium]